jgi:porin
MPRRSAYRLRPAVFLFVMVLRWPALPADDAVAQPASGNDSAQAATPVPVATHAPPTDFWNRANLLPDWDGWRSGLADTGWTPFAIWTGEIWDNAAGGVRDGMTNDQLLNFGAGADLQKLLGWDGATLQVSFNWAQSTHPNHDTGALNEPSSVDANDQVRVNDIYLQQKLFDGQLILKAGQIAMDEDFAQCAGANLFLNAGMTNPPVVYSQVLANGDTSVPQFPLDAPGLVARYNPQNSPVYAQAGLYLSDPGADVSHNHGFDWHPSNSVFVIEEAGWNYQLGGKAGTLAAGAYYNNGQFTNWNTGATQRGLEGAYFYLSQALVQTAGTNGGDPQPVLTGFIFGGVVGPDTRVIPNDNCAAGFNWHAPLPARPNDVAGAAVLYTGLSRDYTRSAFNSVGAGAITAGETDVEFTYEAVVTPWFSIQPDLQLIFNPANAGTRATATVVGARATVTF